MTARQPRRARRRTPSAPLARPSMAAPADLGDGAAAAEPAVAATRRRAPVRAHHVTTDYSYVHKDLLTVSVISVVILAFIVGMSFVL